MNIQPVGTGQVPAGCVPVHGFGEGVGKSNVVSVYDIPGTRPATPSGVPWGVQDHCEYHYPEGHECRAPKVRGDVFCIGHKRARIKAEKESARTEEEPQAEQEMEQVLEAEIQE